MKKFLIDMADTVYCTIKNSKGILKNRVVNGYSDAGDAQFSIDSIAEKAVLDFCSKSNLPLALFTEDEGLVKYNNNPEYILIVDPIDGTRPAAANLEMSCISIAVAKYSEDAKISDISFALLKELKTGYTIYSDNTLRSIECNGYTTPVPNLSNVSSLFNMFWSIEFNGHPAPMMTNDYGHLIDLSANNGGVFIFNSASYSISRIITGQLDAYVDIGNRLLKDNLDLLGEFKRVGNGNVLHLFPYDIAASVYLAEKANVVITDAYGNSLKNTLLMDLSYQNQQSCIAASNRELHSQLINSIKW
jgi:myo-inositol-1(or 4)-monophosphatase